MDIKKIKFLYLKEDQTDIHKQNGQKIKNILKMNDYIIFLVKVRKDILPGQVYMIKQKTEENIYTVPIFRTMSTKRGEIFTYEELSRIYFEDGLIFSRGLF